MGTNLSSPHAVLLHDSWLFNSTKELMPAVLGDNKSVLCAACIHVFWLFCIAKALMPAALCSHGSDSVLDIDWSPGLDAGSCDSS